MLAEKFLTTLAKRNGESSEKKEKEKEENEYKVLGLYMRVVDQIKHLLDYIDSVEECRDENLTYEPCKCVSVSGDEKEKEKGKERWDHVDLVNHFKFSHHYHCSVLSVLNQQTEIVVYDQLSEDEEEDENEECSDCECEENEEENEEEEQEENEEEEQEENEEEEQE